jgi:hypothetical protein
MRAGGCWCERWDGQSVEHGRVILVMEHEGVRTLRFLAPLWPAARAGVNGVLTFTIAPHASGAKIKMTYRVSGDAGLGLDQIAPGKSRFLWNNSVVLVRFSASGSPD